MTKKQIREKIKKLKKLLGPVKPRGKPKGSAYERTVAKQIVKAFCKLGIQDVDCYRTPRGSKKGDLFISSALEKYFPFTVECKFYKSVPSLHMLRTFEEMQKSWPWKKWWLQLQEEVLITKKPGLLVFRENNGIDLVSFIPADTLLAMSYLPRFITYQDKNQIWTVRFEDFLKVLRKAHKNGNLSQDGVGRRTQSPESLKQVSKPARS